MAALQATRRQGFLVLDVLSAIFGPTLDQVKAAAETCSANREMGFGATTGLIGGNAM